ARLIRDGERLQLGMYSGTAQRFVMRDNDLSVLDFDQLVYDLGPIQQGSTRRNLKPEEYFFYTLINPPEEIWNGSAKRYGQLIAEGHDQLSAPLYALTLPLVALAVFLSQGFQRGGFALRIGLALAAGVGFRVAGVVLKAQVVRMPEIWPVLYLPPLLMFAGSLALLGIGANPIQRWRRRAA
ncbi:MAG: LptF/LptG family permease, partial [Pseudomonadota bacterium]